MRLQINLLLFLLLYSLTIFGQSNKSNDYLLSFIDTTKNKCGYLNQNGDTVIRADNYSFCFTDTFRTYAIVVGKNLGFVAIDRQKNILYKVFPFDNGPDYAVDGLFRIIIKNKIGYADEATGKIIIKPQFDCAFPFDNGIAKVGMNCKTYTDDSEHHTWTTDSWIYIDKRGRKVNPPSSK
ncbi:MAG: WG repeat-containing protein [Bacteroidetes bacterium]|nr:WG repeat-containing protein [Bacteroidota bacterium]